jgi:peptidoglycan/LPS O-acetylase OafA/YrhL
MKIRPEVNPLPKQFQSIELLRGIASLMVCYFHLARGNPRFLPDQNIIKESAIFGWSGVEIFFVISGFVIPFSMYRKKYTISNFFTFFKKRIIRIEPPYLISVVLVVVLNFASSRLSSYRGAPFHFDWPNILGHIAYLNIFTGSKWLNDVYWSLAIEFQYYLFIALSFTCIISGKAYVRVLFILAFGAFSFIPVPYGRFLFSFPGYFIAGILLFQFMCNLIGKMEFFILMILTLALLFYQNGSFLTLLVLATLLVIFFVQQVPAFLRWLGVISYSLYLIHVPIGGRVINFAEVRTGNIVIRQYTVFAALIICIIAAAVYYKLFEQKFKSLSGSIKYRNAGV